MHANEGQHVVLETAVCYTVDIVAAQKEFHDISFRCYYKTENRMVCCELTGVRTYDVKALEWRF